MNIPISIKKFKDIVKVKNRVKKTKPKYFSHNVSSLDIEMKTADISSGFGHTCAIVLDTLLTRNVKCWGLNDAGQTNVPENINTPHQVVAGEKHTCLIH